MATYSKVLLSGGTHGRNIKIGATSSPGTLVHTAVTGTSGVYDEMWLWALNSSTSAVKVTVQFGGTTSPDDEIEVTVPGEAGPVEIVPGWPLRNGQEVRVFAGTTNVIMVNGFANRSS